MIDRAGPLRRIGFARNKRWPGYGLAGAPFVLGAEAVPHGARLNSTKSTKGGEVRIVDSSNFPVSKHIAAAPVTIKPGGIRELLAPSPQHNWIAADILRIEDGILVEHWT